MTAIDTFGWDTAYAVGFKSLNSALKLAGSSPAAFAGSFTDFRDVRHDVTASFGVWQLSGGSGDLVHLELPLLNGRVTVAQGQPLTFKGSAIIEVKLSYRPRVGSPKTLDLMVAPEPHAAVIDADLDNTSLAVPVQHALAEWLQTNLSSYAQVFATVTLDATSTHPAFQWLQPTSASYAVYSDGREDPANAVLGVLAMTEHRAANNAPDIDPSIIPNASTAGLLIAQQRLVDKILMPNVHLLFRGAKPTDFNLADDGLTIVNKSVLTPQNLVLEDGTVVTDATIAPGNFALDVYGGSIRMTVTDLHFTWKSGFNIHVDYIGTGQLSMTGEHELLLGNNEAAHVSFMITKTEAERWKEIYEYIGIGVALSVVGAVIGGLAGKFGPAATVIYKTVTTGIVQGIKSATGNEVSFSFNGLPDSQIKDFEKYRAQNSRDAAQDIRHLGDAAYKATLFGWFPRSWRKILGGTLASVGGQDSGKVADILDAVAGSNRSAIPTPDAMALDAVAACRWPDLSKPGLTSLDVAGAVRMGLKPKTVE